MCLVLFGAAIFSEAAFAHIFPGQKGGPQSWREEKKARAPDFRLTDQDGRRVSLGDFRGKVVLVTFVYTSCPDLCPLITANVAAIERKFRGRGGVHFISITTDPEVDTSIALKEYAMRFSADLSRWSFLTGPENVLKGVWKAYGVNVYRLGRGQVEHNYVTAIIDGSGIWRTTYHGESWKPSEVESEIESVRRN